MKKEKKKRSYAHQNVLMRRLMPYGMIKDVGGKVVLFNRDYEMLTIAGKREFTFDPEQLHYKSKYKGKFLITDDGGTYAGTMYMLYDDGTSPLFLEDDLLYWYMMRYLELLQEIVGTVLNAQLKNTMTDLQVKMTECKLDFLKAYEQDK